MGAVSDLRVNRIEVIVETVIESAAIVILRGRFAGIRRLTIIHSALWCATVAWAYLKACQLLKF